MIFKLIIMQFWQNLFIVTQSNFQGELYGNKPKLNNFVAILEDRDFFKLIFKCELSYISYLSRNVVFSQGKMAMSFKIPFYVTYNLSYGQPNTHFSYLKKSILLIIKHH